jgi:hypothetical protein
MKSSGRRGEGFDCHLGMSTEAPDLIESNNGLAVVGDISVIEKDFPVVFSRFKMEDLRASFKWADIA